MRQQQPQCVITDQCSGIKKACPNVFNQSVHKYCMWHIMQKIPEKVGRAICNDTEFMTDINAVVWDVDLEPDKFEQNWKTVIEAHGMQSNRWLKYVFAIRQKWIPAYFWDLPLGCLLRTTQRSESSNSYFKRFESHFGTLVEFWMRYNSAIEQQRHTQRRMDNANEHSMLEKVGPVKVEMHASLVYTHPIFADFQNEVKHAICSMGVGGLTTVGAVEYHDVRDGLKHRSFRVEFNTKTNESKCACGARDTRPLCPCSMDKEIPRPILRDENGKVIEDIDEADIKKAEMSKEIEALLGITASNDIDLRPPNKAKNKGSGKRLRSSKEKAKSKPQKRKRRCGNCKKWKRMSDVTDDSRRSPTREEINEAKRTIESLTIELIDTRTNLEAVENREEALIREVDNVKAQLKVAELQNERMRRQLKEKKNRNYTEADMNNQFIAGVNALRKYYTEVDIQSLAIGHQF
ncbi:protein FAR1-RELATED SEQUENCE 5-like [Silene latifolia]|uniref:protein FAR1-RELATED SEQUENCE 5-like n=1 Tax=Silene latifolia TaxID=37657 RepID=UPI003D778D32